MPQRDSLDKVIGVYLASLCRKEFEYKGTVYKPRAVRVSPMLFRGFTCPARCGGCCPRFTLDYLPSESSSDEAVSRRVEVNGRLFWVFSDMQTDHEDHFCRNLDKKTGRCGIYDHRPFSCDFELIRFLVPKEGPVHLTQKLFGRGWNMKRVDHRHGAKCTMTKPTDETRDEVVRKLEQLAVWADYFRIETCVDEIIAWVKMGPHPFSLFLEVPEKLLRKRQKQWQKQ